MVVLTVGTGIGGAILIDGAVYRGRCGTSAEFGNTAIDWQGRDCISGNRGSLNTLASGTALCRRAAELAGGDPTSALAGGVITGERIAAAAARGDAVARRAIDEAARALGAGIANVINVFNPDRVVLAGGLCNLGPAYLDAVRDEAQRRAFPVAAQHAELRLAALGDLAGAHGAACYAAARLGVSAGAAPRTDGTVHLLDGGSRAAQA
jgi:glucokinase